mgnify:CR=1 FL=1
MTRIDLPLIDMHTHIGHLPGVVGDVYHAEDLLYIAEHEGASYMLASSASVTTIGRAYGMAEAMEMASRYGDRLGSMLWVNPHDPDWPTDVPLAAKHGFKGIKIHPVLDHYAVTCEALDVVFACAREHNWPILTHTGDDGTPTSASCYLPLIETYPDVVLILAHLRLEAIPIAKRHDNVYLDTTYVDPMRVELGVDALGADKILFGSDACEGFEVGRTPGRIRPHRSYASIIDSYRQRGLSDVILEKLLYTNAKGVFHLP